MAQKPDRNTRPSDQGDVRIVDDTDFFPNVMERKIGLRQPSTEDQRRLLVREAGKLVNSFQSQLAKEIRLCRQDFGDLEPDDYHKLLLARLMRLEKEQRRRMLPRGDEPAKLGVKEGLSERRATLNAARMAADSIAAYQAAKERTAALQRGKQGGLAEMFENLKREVDEEMMREGEEVAGSFGPRRSPEPD